MDGFNSPDGKMHPDDRRNLIIFAVLSILVWFSFDHYLLTPHLEKMKAAKEAAVNLPSLASVTGAEAVRPRESIIADGQRIAIRNDKIFGSLPLVGARLDDMKLVDHYKTLEKTDHVVLLTPAGAPYAKYVDFGWLPGDGVTAEALPGNETRWQLAEGSADTLTANNNVKLVWNNGRGLRFERVIALDSDSMITVTQNVTNTGGKTVTLYPYALIAQRGLPEEYYGRATVHEGPIGYIGGKLIEHSYKKMTKEPRDEIQATSGWIGITEKYWLTSVIPAQNENTKFRFLYTPSQYSDQQPLFQTDIVGVPRVLKAGETATAAQHVFTGAKKIDSLQSYEESLGVKHFDLAVDFGLWYFLTKPFFWILNFLAGHVGNFGVAIIILTVMVRAMVFPLANASFRSFAQMKKVAPRMKELRDQYADDKAGLQAELVKLYEKEKVNPMAGCLPILIQIPIFFALFKVFSVTIEMRHAPFFGWIH
ncbi:MAG: membrane protein insertase YidC, partial [Alphaproteobacteria bacterium]|nr:membrane protein insertase YidC [Alphaproteobacteria bacterium]